MKAVSITLLASLLGSSAFQSGTAQSTGAATDAIYTGTEAVKLRPYTKIPEFIQFRIEKEIRVGDLTAFLQKNFINDNDYGLKLIKSFDDELGYTHYRYTQTFQNIPVEGSSYTAHTVNGNIRSMNGILYSPLDVNPEQNLSQDEAKEKAIAYARQKLQSENPGVIVSFRWENPDEEQHLKEESGNPSATYFPQGEMVWMPADGNYKSNKFSFAYKFDIYASEPLYRAYVFVDAGTGNIILEKSRIHTADAIGTAVTKYSGTQTMTADSYGGSYRLREAGRGNGISTYDMNTGTNYNNAVDFTDADNFWNNVNAQQDEVATDAHWGAEKTYDYFLNIHSRNSIDGNGFALLSYVHYSSGYSNAFWDGQRMTYGDGSGSYDPFTALDITGHEISHGLTEMTANLDYSYESGALNESFSDIFGAAIEFYGKPAQANWLVGENIGVTLRSMSNPNAYGDPDTYQGTNWYTGTADNGGVHTNSGVQNFWFYLLSQGGSGTNDIGNSFNITGLGITNAAKVAFRNLTVYLWNTAEYVDARFYAIQSAIDLFGPCTAEVIATTNAWYAVGVGSQFNPTVTADFSAPATTSCSLPFTANFSNLSTNAGSYLWNFGDGNTGTQVNPSYTYNTYGTFTVTLIADGGACGTDTTVKTAYIQVDTTLPCILIMPVAGTADVQTACNGTVYDNGGPSSNYSDNNTSLVTISPTGASTVTLNIISFDIEPGSGAGLCDYDHVEFFDGVNTSAPSLGRYCNNIMPPSTITSTAGSITIRHYADPAVNNAGFQITWSCTMASTPPVANFTSDVTSTCTGVIKFADASTNGATSWFWDFGDGGSSTLQNPTYTYANNGTYTVQLTATNAYGSDTEIKTAYIIVNKPTPPTVASASRCGPGSVTLSASGTGNLGWYTDTVGGTPAGSGSTFTTPPLSSTTDYYVEDVIIPASQYVGPQSNSIGNGANYTGNQYLIFHCYSPVTIVSTLVYANGAGNRTIQLRDKNGTVLQDTVMYVQDGATRITLNFDVPVSDSLQLGIAGTPDLYRNSTGTSYPYSLAGFVSIIQSSAAFSGYYTYYYFFYDWEVREPICKSERAKITATINPVPTSSISVTDPISCYSSCDGGFSASITDGTPPYTYLWSTGASTLQVTGACAGTYTISVTDINSCSTTATGTLTQPPAISLAFSVTNATCGNSNGSVTVNVSNSTPPLTYLWSNGGDQLSVTGLAAGAYSVTVTDGNGCTGGSSVMVNNDVPVASILSTTDPTCNGFADGQAVADASGGTLPYTYLWSAGAGTQSSATGLSAGTYTVTVSDISGCISTATAVINNPPAVSISISSSDASCGTVCNGMATAATTGGIPPITYLWSNGSTQMSAASLCQGIYTITITDYNGCTGSASATVNNSSGFTASVLSVTNSPCTSCTGEASVGTSGGNAPFTYQWNDPGAQDSATATGLCAGNYMVTVTDIDNCTAAQSFTVMSSGGLLSSISSLNDASCNGYSDGSVTVSANGGAPPYSYQWSASANNQTTATATGLSAGFYSVLITDSGTCITSAGVSVGQPQPITVVMSPDDTICLGNNTVISATASGGNGLYTYIWDNMLPDASTHTVAPTGTTTYTVIVNDQYGCTSLAGSLKVFVDVCSSTGSHPDKRLSLQIFPNPNHGKFTLMIHPTTGITSANNQPYTILISNLLGQKLIEFPAGPVLTLIDSGINPGLYYITVRLRDSDLEREKLLIIR